MAEEEKNVISIDSTDGNGSAVFPQSFFSYTWDLSG